MRTYCTDVVHCVGTQQHYYVSPFGLSCVGAVHLRHVNHSKTKDEDQKRTHCCHIAVFILRIFSSIDPSFAILASTIVSTQDQK